MNSTTPAAESKDAVRATTDSIRELTERLRGEVRFDRGSRALYATDGSNYRQVPLGVVVPQDIQDVVNTFAVAARHGLPVLSRGGGTSLAGQCCNAAVVIDYSKHLQGVIDVDPSRRIATALPGTYLDTVRASAEQHGLTFGPDPSTHTHCTIGGMIGNDSCGAHALLSEFYGPGPRTHDNVHELEVMTYDGLRLTVGETSDEQLRQILSEGGRRARIYEQLVTLRDRYADRIRSGFPDIPRRVSGYNLPALLPENGFNVAQALTGTEGTCVAVLGASLKLVPHLPERVLVVLGYPSIFEAGDDIEAVRQYRPVACEGIDGMLVAYMKKKQLHPEDLEYLPDGNGWLLVEFGADSRSEALHQAERFQRHMARMRPKVSVRSYSNPVEQAHLWEIRESGLGATAYVPGQPDTWSGWEDAAVPPNQVGSYLRRFQALLEDHGYGASLYGHLAQGCVHCRINFDLKSEAGIQRYQCFTREAADLVVEFGGSLSGEHGDGQARGELLPRMYGEELMEAFREFKLIWDPRVKMNPGKVVDAQPRTAQLRLGAGYAPWDPETHFSFHEDHGSLAHAAQRCVGVGKCRRDEGGTMCPSFMVTREEKHSTRGRAHLLFEMLQGEPLGDGWNSQAVEESLQLCLACKGCTSECPVSVDIPTYKAEFLAHHYEARRRPRQHYAFGWIDRWARLGSRFPRLANWGARAPGLGHLAKWVAGMAQERAIPELASETFREWFGKRTPGNALGKPVVLWPDTFNDHFRPQTLQATVRVLEAAGYHVRIPSAPLCCGRALYDYGMLERAKELWTRVLDQLEPVVNARIPIVGVEPSCVAAFRDELVKLMTGDKRAEPLSRHVFTLAELLTQDPSYEPPRLPVSGSANQMLWQEHCHHKAIMGTQADAVLLQQLGVEVHQPNDGCCGMAGSFGFEKDKLSVSLAVAERRLYPALRANPSLPVLADGFSCREQVRHQTGQVPLHLAEVLARAHDGQGIEGAPLPKQPDLAARAAATLVVLSVVFLLGLWAL